MANSKMNEFLKHKRLIIIGLILIGLMFLIFFTYLLTFLGNRPVIFSNKDAKVINADKIELFDCRITANEIKYKEGSTNGSINFNIEITDLKQDLEKVSVEIELNNNWTNTQVAGSTYQIEDGRVLKRSNDAGYTEMGASIDIKNNYPIKVLPFVSVKNPNIYAKITYTKTTSADIISEEARTETIYVVYNFNDYCTSKTQFK